MKITKGGLITIYALLIAIPIVSIFFTTFKSSAEMYQDVLGLPESFDFGNYVSLFIEESMNTYFINSVIVTLISVSMTSVFCQPHCVFHYPYVRLGSEIPYSVCLP